MKQTTTASPLPEPTATSDGPATSTSALPTPLPNPIPLPEPFPPTLESALLEARGTIGSALRLCIASGLHETDPQRLKLENVFEAVRAEIGNHQFTLDTLQTAATAAGVAVTRLANTSRTEVDKLQALRGDANRLAKLAAALGPQPV